MTAPAHPEPRVDPRDEYRARRRDRAGEAARLARRDARIGNARLVVAAVAVLAGWLAFGADRLHPAWIALPAAAFFALVLAHDRIVRRRIRMERAAAWYEAGLERLDGRRAGDGEPGDRFLEEGHLYAMDLDLFGRGSLYERLATARTPAGEETLARWLLRPAPADVIRARQAAVEDLRGRIDLREDLALLGDPVRAGVDPDALRRWSTAPTIPFSAIERIAAFALPIASVAALALWSGGLLGRTIPVAVLLAQVVLARRLRPRVERVLAGVDRGARELGLLSGVLRRIEQERFEAPLTQRLRARLETAGDPPSRSIGRLHRLVTLLDARRNQMFAPVAMILMWGTHLALRIEAWRRRSGDAVPGWIAATGEIEALCAIAGYAWENPSDPFPVLIDGPARLEAAAIGHPLIPGARCVRNDVVLDATRPVLIVSGSNMSGKSTLLRTVGVNVVLALAGAPVRARAMRLTPLALGASIRVIDSLQAGTSRFYAEVTRLRGIVAQADRAAGDGDGLPVCFLIDEMLHGTNSHDRRIGAEAVVRGLVERGALGIVTTHDLALSRMAESLGGRAVNVHFEDHLEDGRMTFDYILRDGVVTRSNALALMRSVGLDVGEDPDGVVESDRSGPPAR